ncbi:MAG: hypothetical protein ACRBBQ_08090 [Cognatishimia sp.]
MIVQDLGCLSKDVLLFGGPNPNLQATPAPILEAARLKNAADHLNCTGYIAGPYADTCEFVEMIRGFELAF